MQPEQPKLQFTIPYKVRAALYIVTGLLTPVMIYLLARNIIGTLEMALWSTEVAFVMGLASANTSPNAVEKQNSDLKL